jgi:hypothetical protein
MAKIVLKNLEDKSWEVNYMSHGWNHVLSGGLKAFERENKLKIGDIRKRKSKSTSSREPKIELTCKRV